MRNFVTTAFLSTALLFSAVAQDLPVASPPATVKQRVGLTDVTIEYNRPSAKGRTIFGDLVPYDQMWRTGANKATRVEFTTPVKFGSASVEPGAYALFSVPGQTMWQLTLSSNTEQWGEGDYKEEEEVARVRAAAQKGEMVETMLIYFDNVTNNSADMVLAWENTRVTIPIVVDSDAIAEANIKAKFAELDNNFRIYNNSANYYLENGKDAKKALEWAKKSTELSSRFWNEHTLARAYAANGMYAEAIATAQQSRKLAEEAEYPSYVKMNDTRIAEWTPLVPAKKGRK